jgi:hypothetical protein
VVVLHRRGRHVQIELGFTWSAITCFTRVSYLTLQENSRLVKKILVTNKVLSQISDNYRRFLSLNLNWIISDENFNGDRFCQ